MTLDKFRTLTKDLPGDLTVSVVVNSGDGGDHALRTITIADGALLLCSDNQNCGQRERVIYDATPEPRMD